MMAKLMVAVLTVTALLVPAARSAPHSSTAFIELRGNDSASAIIVLRDPVSLKCCTVAVHPKEGPYIKGMTAKTKGTYVGFVIEKVGENRPLTGALRVPQFDLQGWYPTLLPLGIERTLPPGTYRIHLITDGPSTVRIPLAGLGRNLILEPGQSSPAKAAIVDIGVGDSGSGYASVPITVTPRTTVAMASYIRSEVGLAYVMSQCVGRATDLCQTHNDRGQLTFHTGVAEGFIQKVYRPGKLPVKGPTDISFTAVSGSPSQALQGLAFTFR